MGSDVLMPLGPNRGMGHLVLVWRCRLLGSSMELEVWATGF